MFFSLIPHTHKLFFLVNFVSDVLSVPVRVESVSPCAYTPVPLLPYEIQAPTRVGRDGIPRRMTITLCQRATCNPVRALTVSRRSPKRGRYVHYPGNVEFPLCPPVPVANPKSFLGFFSLIHSVYFSCAPGAHGGFQGREGDIETGGGGSGSCHGHRGELRRDRHTVRSPLVLVISPLCLLCVGRGYFFQSKQSVLIFCIFGNER